jgi:hypothetical protein
MQYWQEHSNGQLSNNGHHFGGPIHAALFLSAQAIELKRPGSPEQTAATPLNHSCVDEEKRLQTEKAARLPIWAQTIRTKRLEQDTK